MRVLIDYRPALRRRTGVGEFVHQAVTALARLAATDPEAGRLDLTVFSASWRDRLADTDDPLPEGVRWVDRRIPVRALNRAWHHMGWPPIERLAGASFDVVHSPEPLLMPARDAARVITIHDLDFLDHPEWAEREAQRDYPALVRRHAHRADRIVVPSEWTGAEVTRRLDVPAERIAVCRHGAPDIVARETVPAHGHLLFVGALTARKNVAGLVDAYARLVERRPGAPALVLAGAMPDGPAPDWRSRCDAAPLAGRVRVTGYVDRATRDTLYAGARALVLPSFNEGFGLPALEAMAAGVPVVAAKRGALPEVVGDAGLLVDPDDPAAIADALERLLDDDELAARGAARGRERAQAFTWEASARALCEAYRQAIVARRPA